MLPFFQDRRTSLHALHPAGKLAITMAAVVAGLLISHPVYLAGLLAGTVALAAAGRVLREWWSFMRLFLVVALLVVVINMLVSGRGSTDIWSAELDLGFLGEGRVLRASVSWEGLAFGAVMAVRLFLVVSAFTVFSLTAHPDELARLLSRFAYRSGLAVSMSARFYPAVVRDASNIVDAQRSRGLDLDTGGRIARFRRRLPVVMPLFHTSMERAVGTAEAMEARGFGGEGRTRWRSRAWEAADGAALVLPVLLLALTGALLLSADGSPQYYPVIRIEAGWVMVAYAALLATLLVAPTAVPREGGGPRGG